MSENVFKIIYTLINLHGDLANSTTDPISQMGRLRLTKNLRNMPRIAEQGKRGARQMAHRSA